MRRRWLKIAFLILLPSSTLLSFSDQPSRPVPATSGVDWAAATRELSLNGLRNPVWATQDNLRDPSVVKVRGGYWLFYSRFRGTTWASSNSWTVARVFTVDFQTFDGDRDVTPKGFASPGDVVFWGGRYILPYQSYPESPVKLHYSESKDLVHWSAPQPFLEAALKLPWNALGRVIDPTLVVQGDVLHCYLVGSARHEQPVGRWIRANLMGHAITRDPRLMDWEILSKAEPLVGWSEAAPDGVENMMVIKTGESWTMLYSEGLADQHLARATSKDLRAWKLEGPLLIPRQRWCARKYGAPFVWREGTRWIMILMGENEQGRTSFGLLTSEDAIQWTPLPERP